MFYSKYLLLLPPALTKSCVHWMIAATIYTFTWELTVINVVVRILLTTFPAHFTSFTIILMMAIFLAFVTSQYVGYVLLEPIHCIDNFYFFGYFLGVKLHYICICLYCFPFFLIDTLFTSVAPCFFSSLFISSIVHKESSLLLRTPLLTFRDVRVSFDTDIVKLCHFL